MKPEKKEPQTIAIPSGVNGYKPPQELVQWIEDHKEELLLYPNHYLLITLPKGIVASGLTQEELYQKVYDMSHNMGQFSVDELKQPCFIINTLATGYNSVLGSDRSKWGQA